MTRTPLSARLTRPKPRLHERGFRQDRTRRLASTTDTNKREPAVRPSPRPWRTHPVGYHRRHHRPGRTAAGHRSACGTCGAPSRGPRLPPPAPLHLSLRRGPRRTVETGRTAPVIPLRPYPPFPSTRRPPQMSTVRPDRAERARWSARRTEVFTRHALKHSPLGISCRFRRDARTRATRAGLAMNLRLRSLVRLVAMCRKLGNWPSGGHYAPSDVSKGCTSCDEILPVRIESVTRWSLGSYFEPSRD